MTVITLLWRFSLVTNLGNDLMTWEKNRTTTLHFAEWLLQSYQLPKLSTYTTKNPLENTLIPCQTPPTSVFLLHVLHSWPKVLPNENLVNKSHSFGFLLCFGGAWFLISTRRKASMLLNLIKFDDRLLQSPDILCLTIFRLPIRTATSISCYSTSLKRHYSGSANGCWLPISGKIFT